MAVSGGSGAGETIVKSKGKQITLSLALLLAGGILILAGVLRGEAQTVLEKAIRICVECIGLG